MQENAGPNENNDKRKFCFQIYEDQIEILNRNTQLNDARISNESCYFILLWKIKTK